MQPDLHMISMKDSEGRTNSRQSSQFGRCIQQSAIQTAMELLVQYWHSQDGSQQHSRKERSLCTWKLKLHAPTTDNGTFMWLSPVPSPLHCLHKGTGGSEQQWLKTGAHACRWQAYLQNSHWQPHSSYCCLEQLEKVSQWCQETGSENKQGAIPVVHPQQQSSSNLLQQRSHRTHGQPQISRDLLWHTAHVNVTGRIIKTEVHERTVHAESHGCKRHQTMSSVPVDTQRHWLWFGSHNPVTVQPAEAWQSAIQSH